MKNEGSHMGTYTLYIWLKTRIRCNQWKIGKFDHVFMRATRRLTNRTAKQLFKKNEQGQICSG